MLRALPLLLLVACGTPPAPAPDAGPVDAGPVDAGPPDAGDKSAACASSFGSALTDAFGRVDGTVVAVVTPEDTRCPLPNDDHVIVQVRLGGEVYRMVVNVLSTRGDPDVRTLELDAPLPGGPWAEGWHPGLSLDYVSDLGKHAADFTPAPMAELVGRLDAAIPLGEPISVFATSSGGSYADSAHLVHRNGSGHDGAIVLRPTSASPHWLLFSFADQSF